MMPFEWAVPQKYHYPFPAKVQTMNTRLWGKYMQCYFLFLLVLLHGWLRSDWITNVANNSH